MILIIFLFDFHHLFFLQSSDAEFYQALEDIASLPEFFNDAMNWGIEASEKALGFIAAVTLAIKTFKR